MPKAQYECNTGYELKANGRLRRTWLALNKTFTNICIAVAGLIGCAIAYSNTKEPLVWICGGPIVAWFALLAAGSILSGGPKFYCKKCRQNLYETELNSCEK